MAVHVTYEEFPVFVPMGDEALCSIVCTPVEPSRDLGVVLLTGGNYTRTHRNRMWVRAARELAARGYPSIRVDYRGVGDSSGEIITIELEKPFASDGVAAAEFLQRATGVSRVAFAATCFGGRTALASAAIHADTVAVTMFPVKVATETANPRPTVRNRVGRWVRKHSWGKAALRYRPASARRPGAQGARGAPSPRVTADLLAVLRRGAEVRFVYGEQADSLPQLRRLLAAVEPKLTPDQRGRVHVDIVPGTELHGFHQLRDQDLVIERVVDSVQRSFASLTGSLDGDSTATVELGSSIEVTDGDARR